jgi:hypothetical protein
MQRRVFRGWNLRIRQELLQDQERWGSLGRAKISDAIPILVDCSERRLIFGGLSSHNYPAIDPLLHFGDDAIPTLMKNIMMWIL